MSIGIYFIEICFIRDLINTKKSLESLNKSKGLMNWRPSGWLDGWGAGPGSGARLACQASQPARQPSLTACSQSRPPTQPSGQPGGLQDTNCLNQNPKVLLNKTKKINDLGCFRILKKHGFIMRNRKTNKKKVFRCSEILFFHGFTMKKL